jgi:tetratricopeptide (TPR) repeat protein
VCTRLLPILLSLFFFLDAPAQDNGNPLLTQLDHAIEATPKYDADKLRSIEQFKLALDQIKSAAPTKKDDLPALFKSYSQLYEAYKVFNYDSAFTYARQLQATALQLGDPARITYARLKLDFCLLSSGLFKETLDSLSKIHIREAPDSLQAEYYALLGRYYYDLGDFDNDAYNTPDYIRKGNDYMDSALQRYPPLPSSIPILRD